MFGRSASRPLIFRESTITYSFCSMYSYIRLDGVALVPTKLNVTLRAQNQRTYRRNPPLHAARLPPPITTARVVAASVSPTISRHAVTATGSHTGLPPGLHLNVLLGTTPRKLNCYHVWPAETSSHRKDSITPQQAPCFRSRGTQDHMTLRPDSVGYSEKRPRQQHNQAFRHYSLPHFTPFPDSDRQHLSINFDHRGLSTA